MALDKKRMEYVEGLQKHIAELEADSVRLNTSNAHLSTQLDAAREDVGLADEATEEAKGHCGAAGLDMRLAHVTELEAKVKELETLLNKANPVIVQELKACMDLHNRNGVLCALTSCRDCKYAKHVHMVTGRHG